MWELLEFHFDGADGIFRCGFVDGGDSYNIVPRPVNGRARSLHDVNGFDPRHLLSRTRVDAHDFGVGVGGTQYLAIQHAGTMDVIGVLRLPRDFNGSINASDARADQGTVLSIGPCIIRHRSGSFLRDLRDGFANSFVGAAATEIAAEAAANVFGRGMRMAVEKGFAGDDKPRRAETTLRGIVFDERPLHRVQVAAFDQ